MANFGTATFTAVLNNAPLIAGAAQAQGALGGIGRGLNRVGTAITQSVTVPTVLAGGAAVAQASRIQRAWNEVRKVYEGNPRAIKQMIKPHALLGKAVSDLSIKYGVARGHIVEILADIAAMGYTGKTATKLLTSSIEFAVAAGIDLEDGLRAVTTVMQTFELRGKKLDKALAGLNLTENDTAARGLDLAVGLSRAGGAAQAIVGPAFSANDAIGAIAAGMAVLKERGQETYRSADALRAIFQRIYLPPSDEVNKLWEKMGVNIADAEGKLKPFPQLLEDVAGNFDKLTQQEQLAFGKKAIGVEFGPLFLQLIDDVSRGVESGERTNSRYLETVDRFGDTAAGQRAKARELRIEHNSLNASLGRVAASWGLLIDTLKPIINKYAKPISKWIGETIRKFSEMSQAQQENILKWIAIGAAVGPLLLILGNVGTLIASVVGGFAVLNKFKLFPKGSPLPNDLGKRIFSGLKTAVGWAFKMLGGGIVRLMGPIGMAISVGFGAIATKMAPLFAKLGKAFGFLKKFIGPVFTLLRALNPVVLVISLLVAGLIALSAPGNDAGSIFEKLKEIWSNLVSTAKELWEAVKPILGWLRENIAPLFRDAFLDIFAAIGKLLPLLKPLAIILGALLVGAVVAIGIAFRVFAAVLLWVAGIVAKVVGWILKPFTWLYDQLVGHSVIPDLINGMIKWFKMIMSVIVPIVKFAIRFIVGVFKLLWRAAKVVWKGISKAIVPVAKFIFAAVKAYLKVFIAFWKLVFKLVFAAVKLAWKLVQPIFKALVAFVKNVIMPVVKALYDNVIKPVFTRIGDIIRSVWNNVIKPVFTALKDFITDKVVPAFRAGVDKIGELWEGLKSAAAAPVNFVIDTVYNNGLRKAMNLIPGVELGEASPISFAKGGVMPGYTPGRDVHQFWSPTAGGLALSGGEGIMRPEFTRAVGGPKGIAALNRMAMLGRFFLGGVIPASGSINRHTSGYPWATWAGDINQPGDETGAPIWAWNPGQVAYTGFIGSAANPSYGNTVRMNHPGNQRTLYAHMSQILVKAGQEVAAGQLIGRVGGTGNVTGPHLHFELAGGSNAIGEAGVSATQSAKAAAKAKWSDIITKIPGMIKDLWTSIQGMTERGEWWAVIKGAAKSALNSVAKYINDLIPNKFLPDNPIPTFDRGGWMQPGLAANMSRRPEAVFTEAQFNRIFPAMDAMASVVPDLAVGGRLVGSDAGNSRPPASISMVVNNPLPERASQSVTSKLRDAMWESGWTV